MTLFPSETLPFDNRGEPHTCHARDCGAPVPPELLMCGHHWRLVPKDLKSAVWGTYRPGQSDDKRPSREWLLAAEAAIGFVARLEKRVVLRSERAALEAFGYRR